MQYQKISAIAHGLEQHFDMNVIAGLITVLIPLLFWHYKCHNTCVRHYGREKSGFQLCSQFV